MDKSNMNEIDPRTYFFDQVKIDSLAGRIAECNRVVNCFDDLIKKAGEAQSEILQDWNVRFMKYIQSRVAEGKKEVIADREKLAREYSNEKEKKDRYEIFFAELNSAQDELARFEKLVLSTKCNRMKPVIRGIRKQLGKLRGLKSSSVYRSVHEKLKEHIESLIRAGNMAIDDACKKSGLNEKLV